MASNPSAPIKTIKGTCVAIANHDSEWRGILIRGKSGAGKSDLALRLLHNLGPDRACLVSDDYVEIEINQTSGAGVSLMASPPASIAGLIEVRGVGIVPLPFKESIALTMVVDLVARNEVERLPEQEYVDILDHKEGMQLPALKCHAFDASTVAKICLVFNNL